MADTRQDYDQEKVDTVAVRYGLTDMEAREVLRRVDTGQKEANAAQAVASERVGLLAAEGYTPTEAEGRLGSKAERLVKAREKAAAEAQETSFVESEVADAARRIERDAEVAEAERRRLETGQGREDTPPVDREQVEAAARARVEASEGDGS